MLNIIYRTELAVSLGFILTPFIVLVSLKDSWWSLPGCKSVAEVKISNLHLELVSITQLSNCNRNLYHNAQIIQWFFILMMIPLVGLWCFLIFVWCCRFEMLSLSHWAQPCLLLAQPGEANQIRHTLLRVRCCDHQCECRMIKRQTNSKTNSTIFITVLVKMHSSSVSSPDHTRHSHTRRKEVGYSGTLAVSTFPSNGC